LIANAFAEKEIVSVVENSLLSVGAVISTTVFTAAPPSNTLQITDVFVPLRPLKTVFLQSERLEQAQSLNKSRYSTPPLFPFSDHACHPIPLSWHSSNINFSSISQLPSVACWYPNSPTINGILLSLVH